MRVLLCRAPGESRDTARALARLGFDAVIAPVLAVETLPFALPDARPGAVIATSARAVEALTGEQAGRLRPCPAYAVGARTARAWRGAGFADVRVARGDAPDLAALLALTLPVPARLLYLAGRVRAPELEDTLTRAGRAVEVVETYVARPAEPWAAAVAAELRAGRIDACLHYSARSASLAVTFAKAAGCEAAFADLRHVCLSDAVALALRADGIAAPLIAAEPTEASLVQALRGTIPRP